MFVCSAHYMSTGCSQPLNLLEFKFTTEEHHSMLWKDYKTNGGWKGHKDRERVFIYV